MLNKWVIVDDWRVGSRLCGFILIINNDYSCERLIFQHYGLSDIQMTLKWSLTELFAARLILLIPGPKPSSSLKVWDCFLLVSRTDYGSCDRQGESLCVLTENGGGGRHRFLVRHCLIITV